MGRALYFYDFSSATWRAHIGSKDPAVEKYLVVRAEDASIDLDRQVLDAVKIGELHAAAVGREGDLQTWAARELVSLGQKPLPSPPEAEAFWYTVSQRLLFGGEIDDEPLATTGVERRVVRYLGAGRPLIGEGFAGEGVHALSNVYGWLDAGDETEALANVLASPAWAGARAQQRNPKRWDAARDRARDWVAALRAAGKDVFFTSDALA
jgi:hypothetical protein